MKKRILQLTGSFLNGGSERQAAALAIGLKKVSTFDVFLATLNADGPLMDEVLDAGFDHVPEFSLTAFYNPQFVRQVRRCATFLQNEGIDLIQTHDFYTNVFGMAAATLAGTKVKIASKRETRGIRSRAQDVVEKAAFGRASKIVANSNAVRCSLVKRGIKSDKIEVIYNGIDIDAFQAARPYSNGLKVPEGARAITLVANLRHAVKNVPMFLQAARLVADTVPGANFVIAGEGELGDDLKANARNLGIAERTHFIGRCGNVPGLLLSSYACVLTSNAEGFANAIVEYMAAGKPVVATNVGGAAEAMIDGETGYLVESNDAQAMAEKLIELLEDPHKAQTFGRAGKQIAVSRFSRDAQIAAAVSLYNSLLDER